MLYHAAATTSSLIRGSSRGAGGAEGERGQFGGVGDTNVYQGKRAVLESNSADLDAMFTADRGDMEGGEELFPRGDPGTGLSEDGPEGGRKGIVVLGEGTIRGGEDLALPIGIVPGVKKEAGGEG